MAAPSAGKELNGLKVKPSNHCFFYLEEQQFVDLEKLARSRFKVDRRKRFRAISLVAEAEYPLTRRQLEALRRLRRDEWVAAGELAELRPGEVGELARRGLLITDSDEPALAELRRRHEVLDAGRWDPYAALFHFLTKWRDMDVGFEGTDELEAIAEEVIAENRRDFEEIEQRRGIPPGPFYSHPGCRERHELAIPERRSELHELLTRRRTTRSYDPSSPLTGDELSTILYFVYGCHGTFEPAAGFTVLKKTSPAGGALHSLEVYPLILSVEGVEPGLYHYQVERHALERIEALSADEARRFANEAVAGQAYPRTAGALFLLAARFDRQFWKYQGHPKAFTALLLEAGHLSQTFYLVCEELGLGAFVTAAVNAHNIEERLALNGFEQGAVAISGCGRRSPAGTRFDPKFESFVPRR